LRHLHSSSVLSSFLQLNGYLNWEDTLQPGVEWQRQRLDLQHDGEYQDLLGDAGLLEQSQRSRVRRIDCPKTSFIRLWVVGKNSRGTVETIAECAVFDTCLQGGVCYAYLKSVTSIYAL
jgi:hypothetical protein